MLPRAPAAHANGSQRSPARPEVGLRTALPPPSSSASSVIPAELTKDQGFVRVPAEKLDALLTRSGELLVARRQVEAWTENLAELREFVLRWKGEWRCVQKPLGKLLAHAPDERSHRPDIAARRRRRRRRHVAPASGPRHAPGRRQPRPA